MIPGTRPTRPLEGKVALVAGATRGAGRGIALELAAAGATVYATGRSSGTCRSDYDRQETIEGTAALIAELGGDAIPVRVDHLIPEEVRELVQRIDSQRGRLDILVNGIGGEHLFAGQRDLWDIPLEQGLRMLRFGIDSHVITSHAALPLLIKRPGGLVVEVTDGTDEFNRRHYRKEGGAFYDLAKVAAIRLAFAQAKELEPWGATAVSITPSWLRSELMLEYFGVTEENWRDAIAMAPDFAHSETPRFLGRAVTALAVDPEVFRWNGHSLSSGKLAEVYGFTDLDGTRPNIWRHRADLEQTTAERGTG